MTTKPRRRSFAMQNRLAKKERDKKRELAKRERKKQTHESKLRWCLARLGEEWYKQRNRGYAFVDDVDNELSLDDLKELYTEELKGLDVNSSWPGASTFLFTFDMVEGYVRRTNEIDKDGTFDKVLQEAVAALRGS